jgi:hypothetical protein
MAAMSSNDQKKDGADKGKKRARMRDAVAERHERAAAPKPSTDEVDKIKYKRGSQGDRTHRQGTAKP